jgi:hypothetical protein
VGSATRDPKQRHGGVSRIRVAKYVVQLPATESRPRCRPSRFRAVPTARRSPLSRRPAPLNCGYDIFQHSRDQIVSALNDASIPQRKPIRCCGSGLKVPPGSRWTTREPATMLRTASVPRSATVISPGSAPRSADDIGGARSHRRGTAPFKTSLRGDIRRIANRGMTRRNLRTAGVMPDILPAAPSNLRVRSTRQLLTRRAEKEGISPRLQGRFVWRSERLGAASDSSHQKKGPVALWEEYAAPFSPPRTRFARARVPPQRNRSL